MLLPSIQLEPGWGQWAEFLVKYLLLPYQLIAEFAWDWLSVHYWTSRFVIVNTMLLSVLEGCALWRLWSAATFRYRQSSEQGPSRFLICRGSNVEIKSSFLYPNLIISSKFTSQKFGLLPIL